MKLLMLVMLACRQGNQFDQNICNKCSAVTYIVRP